MSEAATPARTGGGRVRGIDLARAVAIVGMVMVHFGPSPAPGDDALALAYHSSHGRASILFALLAGVGVTLLAADRSRARLRSARLRLAWRAALLLPLGLVLQPLDHGVLVILQYYALYFVVAGLVVGLADRALLAAAAAVAALGPVVYIGAQRLQPAWFDAGRAAAEWGDAPVEMVRNLLLTGSYPVLTWTAPVLFGVWLGRQDLRSTPARWRLLAGGAAGATICYALSLTLQAIVGDADDAEGWTQLAGGAAHSQMPLWLAGATAVAVAVLAACLLVTDALPRLAWPLVSVGQLAFTVYVVHLVLLAVYPDWFNRDTVEHAVLTVARFTVVTAGVCVLWRSVFARGPLEAALRLPWMIRDGVASRRQPA